MGSASNNLVIAAPDDHRVRALVLARLVTLGKHRPRRNRIARRGLSSLAAAMRMVHGVHCHATHRRTYAAPAHASRLADGLQRMLLVANLADSGAAVDMYPANFARTQPYLRVLALAREQLNGGAGGTGELGALAGKHFYAMDRGADRNILER